MKTLYEFKFSKIERGFQFNIIFCAYSYKEAANILEVSDYQVKKWCLRYTPQTKECIKNPLSKFASFYGGELSYAFPNWRGKILKYSDIINAISEYRKTYKSYQETIKAHNTDLLK